MPHRTTRFLARLAVASLAVLVMSGVGHMIFNSGWAGVETPVGSAVAALAAGRSPDNTVPAGFIEAMGYRPDVDGKPSGSCSGPGDNSYPSFAVACQTHDYGYDLLRFAARQGEPLGPWARLAIDRRFDHDLVAACVSAKCVALAHVYGAAVRFNSLRQGFTTPTVERTGPWATVGGLTVAVAVLPLVPLSGPGIGLRSGSPQVGTSDAADPGLTTPS